MVIARRNLMGGVKLPYDAEVEWLQSNGNEYIETGYVIKSNSFKIETVAAPVKQTLHPERVIASAWNYSNWNLFFCGSQGTDCVNCYGNNHMAIRGVLADEKNYIELVYDGDGIYGQIGRSLKLGDLDVRDVMPSRLSSNPLKLFMRFDKTSEPGSGVKMWSFMLYDGTVLVLDMALVRFTNENGVSEGAMYDRVSGQLFRNAGTGAFVIGPDKVGTELAGGGINA